MRTFALSIHADYGCRERGACCTAGWPIPIEADRLIAVDRAVSDGRLRPTSCEPPPYQRHPAAPPDTPAVLGIAGNVCVFHDRSGPAACRIHRVLGHQALPLACRQFPRVSLCDPRGVSITLSHYCPTAAELMVAAPSIHIVANPIAFPVDGEYVGLDVREALPPLLRPDMLMDWESWWQWERDVVRTIDEAGSADDALRTIAEAVSRVSVWRPPDGPLLSCMAATWAAGHSAATNASGRPSTEALINAVRSAIPAALRPAWSTGQRRLVSDEVRRRFLAAHAFGSWTAHYGQGLRTWLHSLWAADALLTSGATLGQTDLWLRHLADPKDLAAALDDV